MGTEVNLWTEFERVQTGNESLNKHWESKMKDWGKRRKYLSSGTRSFRRKWKQLRAMYWWNGNEWRLPTTASINTCLLHTFSWHVCCYCYYVICGTIQCRIFVYNIYSSYYVVIFSRDEFTIYSSSIRTSFWFRKSLNCHLIRVRHGLHLHVQFVVFMDEGEYTCWLSSWGPSATGGMFGWAAEWLVRASRFTKQTHL